MTAPLVSVSIVTWNSASYVADCLRSVFSQTHPAIEIIIVDNASTDGTRAVVHEFGARARMIENKENLGFCRAHNIGIRSSQGEYILVLNPDVVLERDYISAGVARFLADARTGIVCGKLLQKSPGGSTMRVLDAAGLWIGNDRRFRLRGHGLPENSQYNVPLEVFGADGAAPIYRKAMLMDIECDGEYFDEMFFAHKEDHDLSWRSQLRGWKAWYEPSCVAYHIRTFRPGDLDRRSSMSQSVKFHAVKNSLLLLIKNDFLPNMFRDCIPVVMYQLKVLLYLLLFEQASLKAYWYVLINARALWRKRNLNLRKARITPSQFRDIMLKGREEAS